MKFGLMAVAAAEGAVLAHTTRLASGALPKGLVLTAAALAALAQAGHTHVAAAVLEPGDVAEDAAAARLAAALTGDGMVAGTPAHGRANLAAARAGLFRADAREVTALNMLHEGMTIATLPDATPVQPGALLVTVKIIPFAVAGAALAQAEALAASGAPLRLPAFATLRVGLVLTQLPGMKEAVFQGTVAATCARVEELGGVLLPVARVAHAARDVAGALRDLLAQGAALLLVAGASATVDRHDEAPAGIVLAGGWVRHFGMPVDPGNLICLGDVAGVPALVLPGCARSPSLNGIDLALRLIFAGEPFGRAEIAAMGVGGLLKDFPGRPAPRPATRPATRAVRRAAPCVAALVLAAGLSSRMAPENKLLLRDAHGTCMVARVADALLASQAHPVIAVLGHQAGSVGAALAGRDVRQVTAPDYADGLSASLRAGLAALPAEADAVLVCLGDMPLITHAEIDALLAAYDPDEGRLIVVPTHCGKRGNPVLWDRRYFADMAALAGDRGARGLLLRYAADVVEVAVESAAVLTDFDTRDDRATLLF